MSVYVTETKKVKKTKYWHWPRKAFLFADSRVELHDFAYELKLHPYTFINKAHFPCYPITVCKRYHAIDRGAIPMSDEQSIKFIQQSMLSLEVQYGT